MCGGRGRSSPRGGGVAGGRGLRRAMTIADDDHMSWTEHEANDPDHEQQPREDDEQQQKTPPSTKSLVHASPSGALQLFALTDAPVVSSHTAPSKSGQADSSTGGPRVDTKPSNDQVEAEIDDMLGISVARKPRKRMTGKQSVDGAPSMGAWYKNRQ